jgi:hypothetical protein
MIHGRRDQIWMQKRVQRKAQREEHVGMLTYIWQMINDVTTMGEDRTTQGGCGSIIMCTHSGGRSTARVRASHSRRGFEINLATRTVSVPSAWTWSSMYTRSSQIHRGRHPGRRRRTADGAQSRGGARGRILAGIEADGSDSTVALLVQMRSTALACSLIWPGHRNNAKASVAATAAVY